MHTLRTSGRVTHLAWVAAGSLEDRGAFHGLPPLLHLPASAASLFSESAESSLLEGYEQYLDPPRERSMLVASIGQEVHVYADGVLPVLQLDLAKMLADLGENGPPPEGIGDAAPSPDLRVLAAWVGRGVLLVDTRRLAVRREALLSLVSLVQRSRQLAEYCRHGVEAIQRSWKAASDQLASKVKALQSLAEQGGQQTRTAVDELLQSVITGSPTDAMLQFLTQHAAAPQLQRMEKNLLQAIEFVRACGTTRLQVAALHFARLLEEVSLLRARLPELRLEVGPLEAILAEWARSLETLLGALPDAKDLVRIVVKVFLRLHGKIEPSAAAPLAPEEARRLPELVARIPLDLAHVTAAIGSLGHGLVGTADGMAPAIQTSLVDNAQQAVLQRVKPIRYVPLPTEEQDGKPVAPRLTWHGASLYAVWAAEKLHIAQCTVTPGPVPTLRFAHAAVPCTGPAVLYDEEQVAIVVREGDVARLCLVGVSFSESSWGSPQVQELDLQAQVDLPPWASTASHVRANASRGLCSVYSLQAQRLITFDATDDDAEAD